MDSEVKTPAGAVQQQDETLESKLSQVSLDVTFWTETLKTKCGLTKCGQLRFADSSDIKKLQKCVRYGWETNALRELFGEKDVSPETKRKQQQEEQKEKQERSLKLLAEIQQLRRVGKGINDTAIKEKEQRLCQALQIPDEVWRTMCTDVCFDDVINKLSHQLRENSEMAMDRQELSPTELIKSASGGLVLKGILVTNDTEIRKPVIEPPKDVELQSPVSPQRDETVEFTSRKQSDRFGRSLDMLGYSRAVNAKGGCLGFQAEAGLNKDHSDESEKESESHSNEVYFCKEIISYVPTAVCDIDKTKLKLRDSVTADLSQLESVIEGTSDAQVIQEQCRVFLQNYGSHVNTSSIEFGGVYRRRASYYNQSSSDKQTCTNMVCDALKEFVSGFGVMVGGLVSGNDIKAHSALAASYDKSELSKITLNVLKNGGPQEVTPVEEWKNCLTRHNNTWAVIDRGTSFEKDFVGIWDLIHYNAGLFDNAQKLSATLQRAWQVTNSLTANTSSNLPQDQITNLNLFLDNDVQEWNADPNFVKNLAEYLRQLHHQVQQYCTSTGDSKLWVSKLNTHKPLSKFVSTMLQVRQQIPLVDLSYVQMHVQGVMKLAGEHDFPNRTDLVQWLLAMETRAQANITPLILDSVDINDIPCLIGAIRETLLPAMYSLLTIKQADVIDIQATKDLAEMVVKLQKQLEQDNRPQELFLLLVVLRVLEFDPDNNVFLVRVSRENLEKFTTELENLHQEYLQQQRVGDVETFAFLISCLVNSTAEEENESIRQRDFQQIYCRIQNLLPCDMASLMNKNMATSRYRWDTICSTMDDLTKKGNKVVLDKTSVRMANLNILGSNSQTDTTTDLLDKLGLTKYYPSKMSLQEVIAVGGKPECSTEAQPWIILQKLIMLDYNGRDNEPMKYSKTDKKYNNEATKRDEKEFTLESLMEDDVSTGAANNSLNPLDIFLTVFSCCDLILKQTLLYKMFLCRLAVPFLSPQLSDKSLQLSLWALRSITIEWKGQGRKFMETSIVQHPLKTVSFIRLGKPSRSKSILLNHVMTDQSHHTFWNRECPLGDTQKQVADGLVECQWFLPSGKETDAFTDVTMFLNLRGDAFDHRKQVDFLKQFSNVIVCFLESSDLEKPNTLQMLKQLHSSSIILVLTMKDPESLNQQVLKKQCETYMNYVGISNLANANVLFAFKNTRNKRIGELKQEIRETAKKLLSEQKSRVIEDTCLQMLEYGVGIDEEDTACKTAKQLAQEVIGCMGDKPTHICKNTMLPLQGEVLQKWSQLLKEKERSGRRTQKSNVYHEMADIQDKMTALRQEQLSHSQSLSGLMTTFLKNLTQVVDSPKADLFMQWLKIYMDEKCRDTLPGLRIEYQERWARLNSSKSEGGPQNTAKLKAELVKAEKRLADASLGLEHMLREVAQIYEAAVESEKKLNEEMQENVQQLPAVAAKLLLNGHPIEIMNGDTASVPLTWVKAVFTSLKDLVGDKRLYVISVLGVQSSGKSTLLNTMFGLQFAVSAGRCTRGAFMQLVKVQQARCNYDFVLVVDTEGLRAPELGHSKHTHDNELATFVIGLGDVTIINVKGENMAEISDVLQIAVHAFLRMKLVNGTFQLHRSCVFIHQNVPAVNAKDKMQHGCQKLQEGLDQMTVEVCAIENITDIHSFNQVIGFDRQKQVWYFSDLWHGDPPMAHVNPGYTEKVQEVKDYLLNDLSKKLSLLRFNNMILRIKDIWGGVLSDDFVFSFKNSLAAKAYDGLESTYSKLTWEVEKGVTDWVKNKADVQLEACVTYEALKDCRENLLIELEQKVSVLSEEAEQNLERFFTGESLRDILIEWKAGKMKNLSTDTNEFRNRAKREILQTKERLRIDLVQRVQQKDYEKDILQKAKDLAETTRGTTVNDQELWARFNHVWAQWVNELATETKVRPIRIEHEVEKLLWQHLQKDSPALRNELKNNILEEPLHTTMLAGSIQVADIQKEDLSVRKSFIKSFLSHVVSDNDYRKEAVRVINDILITIDNYLKNLSKQDCRFQESYATFVIRHIVDKIHDHNKQPIERYPFTLLTNLKVKLAIHSSRFAISVFKKMQADYDEKHSIAKKLERYKNTAWNLFKNTLKQASKEVIAADLLKDYLEEAVKKNVANAMPNHVVDEISGHFGYCKYGLMLAILDDLASNDSFDDYISFINNAHDFSLKWVTDFINSTFFTADRGDSKYTKIANSHIYGIIEDLERSIRASTAVVTSSQTLPSISMWCQHFRANLTKLHVPESHLDTVMKQNVMDFENLERLLIRRLRNMKDSVMCTFRDVKSESIRWQGTTPYKQIIQKLWGCQAQCPFCNEPCHRTDANHTSSVNHQCIQHRPGGVAGIIWDYKPRKNQLVIESCNYDVQNATTRFRCGTCKFKCRESGNCSTSGEDWTSHEYTEYKSYLPKWDIAPSSSMESSKYWMWFIATYKHQLKDIYNAELPDIPNAWKNITQQQAKDSLRDHYYKS